ncbi:unnamed protein product [Prorocentrum cordatum]|uniref:Uncharacterized protein n=1 Tax=Prorocentrum cordatum TaxID=2364126 RepID=A0ABN9XLM1_9DINO|nr:unnamed protein product [Polarella glacialis]
MGEARSVSEEPSEPKREGERVRKGDECRDAVVGDWCYRAVVRAQTKAIVEHPERYPGLTKDSPFSDFQAHFHKYGAATCGMPCPSRAKARAADHVTKLDTAADEASTRTTDDHDATAADAEATTSSALVGHEAAEDRATTTTEVTMRPSPEGAVADGAAGSAAAGRPHKDASRNFAAWVDAMEAQTAGPVQVRHTERVADSSTSTDAAHSSAPTESSTATGHAESSSATTSTERGDKHSSNGSTAAGAAESSTIMESFTATEQGESNRQQPVDVRDNPDENHADISSASAAVDAAAAPKAREKAVLLDAGGPTDPSKDGPRAYPSKPGCMLWMHAGCPNHPRRAFKATWYMSKNIKKNTGRAELRRVRAQEGRLREVLRVAELDLLSGCLRQAPPPCPLCSRAAPWGPLAPQAVRWRSPGSRGPLSSAAPRGRPRRPAASCGRAAAARCTQAGRSPTGRGTTGAAPGAPPPASSGGTPSTGTARGVARCSTIAAWRMRAPLPPLPPRPPPSSS